MSDKTETAVNETPEPRNASFFCIRVKMPDATKYSSDGGHESPLSRARSNAIFAAKPQGFEVKWPLLDQNWPVDAEGFTWVPLYHSDDKNIVSRLLDKIQSLEQTMFDVGHHVQDAALRLGMYARGR